jgi:putative transposase
METFSRKTVGWSIDNSQETSLAVSALYIAIQTGNRAQAESFTPTTERNSPPGHPPTNSVRWPNAILRTNLLCHNNSTIESLRSSTQIELLNQKKWRTQAEL